MFSFFRKKKKAEEPTQEPVMNEAETSEPSEEDSGVPRSEIETLGGFFGEVPFSEPVEEYVPSKYEGPTYEKAEVEEPQAADFVGEELRAEETHEEPVSFEAPDSSVHPFAWEPESPKFEASSDAEAEEEPEEQPKKKGFFRSLKEGLTKTRKGIAGALDNLFNGKADIDDELFDEIEEILISADMGVDTTMAIIDELRERVADQHVRDKSKIRVMLTEIMKEKLAEKNADTSLRIVPGKPTVILVIGVNGVGKTTTIGKLASRLKSEGKKVGLAAADTFRAAAIEQLAEWAKRAGVELIRKDEGADPASVVYDAIQAAKSRGYDVLICDTAGRLHNKKNLMNELEKINRIVDREFAEAEREALIVLDATTGQNAILQAKEFGRVTDLTGIVLTKLDGTAKGGVVFPLQLECGVPVKFIGIGEGIDDLRPFNTSDFVDAIFES